MSKLNPEIVEELKNEVDEDVDRVEAQDGDDYYNFIDSCGYPEQMTNIVEAQDEELHEAYYEELDKIISAKCKELG